MFNIEDIFVTVDGKTYRPISGTYEHSPYEDATLDIETVLSPRYEVTHPQIYILPEVVDVIFNDPATIVFWSDNTKTVVKTQDGESYDPEKGMAMAFCKKLMGNNKRDYYHTFMHYLKKYNKQQALVENNFGNQIEANLYCYDIHAAAERFAERFRAIYKTNRGDI